MSRREFVLLCYFYSWTICVLIIFSRGTFRKSLDSYPFVSHHQELRIKMHDSNVYFRIRNLINFFCAILFVFVNVDYIQTINLHKYKLYVGIPFKNQRTVNYFLFFHLFNSQIQKCDIFSIHTTFCIKNAGKAINAKLHYLFNQSDNKYIIYFFNTQFHLMA